MTNWLSPNPFRPNRQVPVMTKEQHKKRMKELREAGCKPKVHTLDNGDKVITKDKGCPI